MRQNCEHIHIFSVFLIDKVIKDTVWPEADDYGEME